MGGGSRLSLQMHTQRARKVGLSRRDNLSLNEPDLVFVLLQ